MTLDIAAAGSRNEAALLRRAADLVRRDGYNWAAPADDGPGHSASSALCRATGCDPWRRHLPECEALHARLAGYLYLTGRATGPADYLPWAVDRWEGSPGPDGSRLTQAEVVNVLDQAGAALTRAGSPDGGQRGWDAVCEQALAAAAEAAGGDPAGEAAARAVLGVLGEEAVERMAGELAEATRIRSMDFRDGAAMDTQPARELAAIWAGAALGLLGDAPNYAEMTITLAGQPDARYAFRVERYGRLTPHQARQEAEARAEAAEARAAGAEAALARLAGLLAESGRYTVSEDSFFCPRCRTLCAVDEGYALAAGWSQAARTAEVLGMALSHLATCPGHPVTLGELASQPGNLAIAAGEEAPES